MSDGVECLCRIIEGRDGMRLGLRTDVDTHRWMLAVVSLLAWTAALAAIAASS